MFVAEYFTPDKVQPFSCRISVVLCVIAVDPPIFHYQTYLADIMYIDNRITINGDDICVQTRANAPDCFIDLKDVGIYGSS